MLVDKNIKKAIRGLVGNNVVTFIDDDMDSNGIVKFSIDDYDYYLNGIQDGNIEFKAIEYFNINKYIRLYLLMFHMKH